MQILKEKINYFLANAELYDKILDKIILIILIIFLAFITNKILLNIIDYTTKTTLKANKKFGIKSNEKRRTTLRKLLKSVVRYIIYFIVFIQILSICGVNTAGILASAGLISVAIGFGAQSLVKDIITGFFIVLEGQFDVGDYVKIYNQTAFIAEGSVRTLGLRSTKIMAHSGEIYFIPNSSINQVINYSQHYNLSQVEFAIKIDKDYQNLEKEINNLLCELNKQEKYLHEFYKNDILKINLLKNIENNIATVEISVKTKLAKNDYVSTMLKKDFYNKFTDRIV